MPVEIVPDPPDPAATIPFDDDELLRALKRLVRTAVGSQVGNVKVARIAAQLVGLTSTIRDEVATHAESTATREQLWQAYCAGFSQSGEGWNGEYGGPDAAQAADPNGAGGALWRSFAAWSDRPDDAPNPVEPNPRPDVTGSLLGALHGLLGLFHAQRDGGRTRMTAHLELGEFTDRINTVAALERRAGTP